MTEGVKIEILDVDFPAEELFGKAAGDQAAPSLVPLAEFQDVKILVTFFSFWLICLFLDFSQKNSEF